MSEYLVFWEESLMEKCKDFSVKLFITLIRVKMKSGLLKSRDPRNVSLGNSVTKGR